MRMSSLTRVLLVAALASGAVACEDASSDPLRPGGEGYVPDGVDPLMHGAGLGPVHLRRLSRAELQRTLRDALGVDATPYLDALPEDERTPFDNDASTQHPSAALTEGARVFAGQVVAAIDDPSLRAMVGCAPTGPTDRGCLSAFVERIGRRLLRRPLTPDEVAELASLIEHAEAQGDFWVAPRLVLRALLQDVEHLYRVEIGAPTPDPDLRALTDFELASRLSFLLWGAGPDDALLDAAQAGELRTPAHIRVQAARLMADPRARGQIQNLHAMWLGYERIPVSDPIRDDLRLESDRLIERVLFDEQRPWLDLFTSEETFVTPRLAEHYGMAPQAEPGWVRYTDERRGLLSHGSFLSGGTKLGVTSPTMRGLLVFERLLCQTIPPPPDGVATDELPPGDPDECKVERWDMSRTSGCETCHQRMDPIGFGLERYGPLGRLREVEEDRPHCAIEGRGELRLPRPDGSVDARTFSGPGELGTQLASTAHLQSCFARQMFQYAVGRQYTAADHETLESLEARFLESDDLLDLILDLVGSESFRHRLETN